MRILPRSRRGTGLLAGAVWLTACVGLWWLLPVVPQAVMTLPIDDVLLGFGPHGDRALVQRHIGALDEWYNQSPYNLDVVAVPSGATIASIARYGWFRPMAASPDGAIWLVHVGHRYTPELRRIDLNTLEVVSLPEQLSQIADTWRPVISPDNRWAIFANIVPHVEPPDCAKGALVWNLATNALESSIPGLFEPFAFTPDGRFLAGCEFARPYCIRIIDMQSHESVKTLVGSAGKRAKSLRFSPDGRYVAAEFHLVPRWGPANSPEAACWNVETGVRLLDTSRAFTKFAAGGRALVGFDWIDRDLKALDVATGERIDIAAVEPNPVFADWDIGPDARTLTSFQIGARTGAMESFFARCGLKWPFADTDEKNTVRVYDASEFRPIASMEFDAQLQKSGQLDPLGSLFWLDDGRRLALLASVRRNVWHIYDLPFRKSFQWFAGGVLLLALPIGFIARRRVCKLRAA